MNYYYHVDTTHGSYGGFIDQAGSIHGNKTGNELSIALLINNEAIVKVNNGLINAQAGLIIKAYTSDEHDQVLTLYYAKAIQEPIV